MLTSSSNLTDSPRNGITIFVARKRRGAQLIFCLLVLIPLFGIAALVVDTGRLHTIQGELQRSADASALAAVSELMSTELLRPLPDPARAMKNARDKAVWFAAANRVENQTPFVDRNDANLPAGDVVIGYLADPKNQEASMTFLDPTRYNSVQVRVQRTAQRNGSVPLTFAAIIGMRSANLKLSATATMVDRVIGFRPTPETGNAMILPIRMHIVTFTQMMSPLAADDYRWDEATQKVEKGSDGINEVEFFPEKDAPGNFGYLDIGIEDNNSNVELGEQLVNGITPADLAAYGGQLVLGDNGTLTLPGIPGQRDSLLSVLESMVGQTRVIPLYNSISGSGSGAEVTIVGFGGIRVMQVDRKGDGRLTVQPAFVSDNNVVIGTRPPVGRFVYAPPQLSR